MGTYRVRYRAEEEGVMQGGGRGGDTGGNGSPRGPCEIWAEEEGVRHVQRTYTVDN
jgi:hypothetical protein